MEFVCLHKLAVNYLFSIADCDDVTADLNSNSIWSLSIVPNH